MEICTYALITPARDELENLSRLVECICEQTTLPTEWIVVDNGSKDGTLEFIQGIAVERPWLRVLQVPGEDLPTPGAPIVRAFASGLAALKGAADVVVKLDADVSMEPDYFERLLAAFAEDPSLGIASGVCYEREGDAWRERHVTAGHVRGASRAYRRACLEEVLPLEERVGWDGIDELKAAAAGWRTGTVTGLPFYHHRAVGAREGLLRSRWLAQGRAAHYMGYRLSYLLLRSLHHARRDPAALLMVPAFAWDAIRRRPRCADKRAVEYLRRQQRIRDVPLRAREAFGSRRPRAL